MKSLTKKYYLYILIVLSSLTFYNPFGIISPQFGKLIFYSICIISLIYAYRNGINLQKVRYPKVAYKMLITGILLSIIMVVVFQNQSLYVTFIATLPYLFGYLVFYILMKFNIPKKKIERAIWIFCFIGMGVYIINMITFPNIILGVEKENGYDMSRGIVRLSIRSLELIVLFFFYSINQWINTKNKIYIWLIILTTIFIILSVTRQYILLSIILGIIFILNKASLSKKIITASLCIIIYLFVLPQIPIYKTMVELSEEQAERNKTEEDIRIKAWNFYIDEYQTNQITRILGNGIPSIGNSNWGNEHGQIVDKNLGGNGCYMADVGWAGFYWEFGLIATIGLLIILLKSILKKKSNNKQFLTYWCIFISVTSITSAPILFYHQIISISTVLYLIYGKEEDCSNHNFKLQQL